MEAEEGQGTFVVEPGLQEMSLLLWPLWGGLIQGLTGAGPVSTESLLNRLRKWFFWAFRTL